MSLRDLVDRKAEIGGPGGKSFQVRGLSLEDVVLLLENHQDALTHVFGSETGADYAEMIRLFPKFVAAAIAYAADEHDAEDVVARMPVGVQLKAIAEVWELSSLDVESVGKLAKGVLNSVAQLNRTGLAKMRMPSLNGSGRSQEPQSSSSPMDTDTQKSSDTQSGG